MNPAIFQRIILYSILSLILALRCNAQKRSFATTEDTSSTTSQSDSTLTTPPRPVTCLSSRLFPILAPADCGVVINDILLREEGVFEERVFLAGSYRTAAGEYFRSRWQFGQCRIWVHARFGVSQMLTFFDVALTANRIIQKCVAGVVHAKGGTSMVGDVSKGFFVNVEGYLEMGSISADITSVPA
ncbi:MAG: hypothetical protein Q9175_008298 [Cornicularia normoerica]